MLAGSSINGTLAAGAAAGQTFQTGDTINANATSGININLVADAANTVAINTAGNVTFRNLTGAALIAGNTNAILWNNVGTFASNQSLGAVDLVNGSLATIYSNTNTVNGSADGMRISLRGGDLAGTADTIKFSVSNSGTPLAGVVLAIDTALTSVSTGVEAISVATAGTNNFSITGATTAATDSRSLVITGAGANTIDARGLTQANLFNLSGASGANTLRLDNVLTSSSTVTGGSGSDTLRVAPTAGNAIANLTVSAVETLRLGNGSTGGQLLFAAAPNFTTVRLDGDSNESDTRYTLNTVGSFATLNFRGDGVVANAGTTQQFQGLTVNNSFAGAADTLAVTLSNSGVALTGAAGYTVRSNGVTANGVETFNATIADSNDLSVVGGLALTSNTLTSAAISGKGVVSAVIAAVNAAGTGSALSTVNLSGITSPAAAAASQAVVILAAGSISTNTAVTGSAGGVALVINAEEVGDTLTFTGTDGFDTINDAATGFRGAIVANMGGGQNALTTGNAATTASITANTANANNIINVGTAGVVSLVATGATSANAVTAAGIVAATVAGRAQVNTITYATVPGAVGVTGQVVINNSAIAFTAAADTIASVRDAAVAAINLANLGVVAAPTGGAATGTLTVTGNANGTPFTLTTFAVGNTTAANAATTAPIAAVVGINATLTGAGSTEAITFTGGVNADSITGGAGADRMTGGTGADLFIQAAGSTAAATAGTAFTVAATTIAEGETFVVAADSITDFSTAQLDTLRIQGVAGATTVVLATTAITNAGANDQFLLRGTFAAGTFTAAAAGVDVLAFLAAGVANGNGTASATLGTSSTVLLGAGANIANIGAQVIA